ncbi:MAG: efflux RND transporter periplasmic adaptor subunit, partial [Gammaproteobacteria bacterium]|nr:efflux RND transporter periplasmic adaptor subunit [Gammaproteobacteria bacterium]
MFGTRTHRWRRLRWLVFSAVVVAGGIAGFMFAIYERFAAAPEAAAEPLIVTIGYGDIENAIAVPGSLELRQIVAARADIAGELIEVLARAGDAVAEGQVLARIDPEVPALGLRSAQLGHQMLLDRLRPLEQALQSAEQQLARLERLGQTDAPVGPELEAARAAYATARIDRDRFLLEIEQSATELGRAERLLRATEIRAPISGTVIALDKELGALVYPADTVMQVANLAALSLVAELTEADLAVLRQDVDVYFTTLGSGSRRWPGVLRQLAPQPADRPNGVVRYHARIDVDNSSRELYPGMTTQAFFVSSSADNVLTVPVGALTIDQADARRATVEIVSASGAIETREITIGARDRINAEVIAGLSQGDRVVAGIVEPPRDTSDRDLR